MYPPPSPQMYPPPPGPPMFFPPGVFKPQRSFARIIFTTLATAVFGLSITLNLYLLAYSVFSSGLGHSAGIEQTVLVAGDPQEKIAVIPVNGMILSNTADRFDQMLTAAEKDAGVKAIVVEVDTPGGAVTPSDEIHARILRFRQQFPNRPVVISMGGLATSGGYYISCAGQYVFAQRTTLTGNIGVILPRYNYSKLAKSYGVEEVTVTAPANGFKNAGSSFAPIDEKDNQYLQDLINDAYGSFKNAVTTGRAGKLTGKIDEIANGKVYTAAEALSLGLVDQLGYATDAYDKAAAMASLSNKQVVKYNKPAGFLESILGGESKSTLPSRAAAATATGGGNTTTINGVNVNVNVDANLLDELDRPRLMYLWRGQ
jgi:protease-4